MKSLDTERIENTVLKLCKEVENNGKREDDWKKYSEEQLWTELVSCILGSRIKYELTIECCNHLHKKGLLEISNLLADPNSARENIRKELIKPIYCGSKYPFSNSKSEYIIRTCDEIYSRNSSIKDILINCPDEIHARALISQLCFGIGPKQASLFLRNISYSTNLAILDTHVLRYMDILGLRNGKKNISTMKGYMEYEDVLRSYAFSLNKKLSILDLSIWVVMRVLRRDFKWV